ncbi:UDP-galactopyranose mutase [Pectinatus frisingensis]|uniref:UDP-galactopyranose mutase n=1 Tax=Pectinatus frisingensis TaxID=865 RepID=UPI0018C84058|nr:UDP-galactopyranose mutase [Pectinatus frisingensis]
MIKYDYMIIGSGLFGSVFAYEATRRGYSCMIIDKRKHIGGNVYCDNKDGINVHMYGAHIFHTENEKVWKYMNQFAKFNNYINTPMANYKKELYNLPFNMNTFNKMWGVITPKEAAKKIKGQCAIIHNTPQNLEEQAISLVGTDIYEKLIKGYTEKQWGRKCRELPAFIIQRLPVRYTYDNNYYRDRYQGIPIGGYTNIINKLLRKCELNLNINFNDDQSYYKKMAKKLVYTGPIDEYFSYEFGPLEYRGLTFKTKKFNIENYQGVAVMNFTDYDVPYTRIIEHKHFEFGTQPVTYVTKEYPVSWKLGDEAYYPINDKKNQELYKKYYELSTTEKNVIFGGRLAEYKYYDMDEVIERALNVIKREFG